MIAEHRSERMTEVQRDTVEKNLGLVGAQIKRMLGRGAARAQEREYYDELFQEGCLGLMQAVRNYRPQSGTTFASYAVPRIHYAVWRALCRYRETIRLPERLARPRSTPADAAGPVRVGMKPNPDRRAPGCVAEADTLSVRSYTPQALAALPDTSEPLDDPDGHLEAGARSEPVTIGGMLRRKLEAAVDAVVERLSVPTKSGSARGALARHLADQRLLVPEASFQASFRQIARATGSSYGRVAACEALLLDEVRRMLRGDVEVDVLRRAGTRRAKGLGATLDDELRDALRQAGTDRIIELCARQPRTGRADALLSILETAGVNIEALLRALARSLADEDRSRLLAKLSRAGDLS